MPRNLILKISDAIECIEIGAEASGMLNGEDRIGYGRTAKENNPRNVR
jgi:hypothetical protein